MRLINFSVNFLGIENVKFSISLRMILEGIEMMTDIYLEKMRKNDDRYIFRKNETSLIVFIGLYQFS